ncbi:MAG: DUF3038 domain-containing protein [Spirulina sp. SIO3F2]|nr:DUF3038 domain-containing protein [Spirulina sp. SIO3F2]
MSLSTDLTIGFSRELELPPSHEPGNETLANIKAHLDIVLLALESLTGLGSEAILEAASTLDLQNLISDRVSLWRLRQANPQRQSASGRKTIDVTEARALVLIVGYLAQEHQGQIRRAVSLLEQMTLQNKDPHRAALLGDYLDRFSNTYTERMKTNGTGDIQQLNHLALKLLVDLLFYSSPQGARRLWLALFDLAAWS